MNSEVAHAKDEQKLSGETTGRQEANEPRSEARGATSSGAEVFASKRPNENIISDNASKREELSEGVAKATDKQDVDDPRTEAQWVLKSEAEGSTLKTSKRNSAPTHRNENHKHNKSKTNKLREIEISHESSDSDSDSSSKGVRKVKTTAVKEVTTSDRETESHKRSDDGSDNKSGDNGGTPGVNETSIEEEPLREALFEDKEEILRPCKWTEGLGKNGTMKEGMVLLQFKGGTKEKDVNKLRRFKTEFIDKPASKLREWEERVAESRRKGGNEQSTAESEEESKWNCQGKMYSCGEVPCICLNRPHSREEVIDKPRSENELEIENQEGGGKGWRSWWKRNVNLSEIWKTHQKKSQSNKWMR